MKHCFILNPMAGKGNSVREWEETIRRVCSEEQVDFEIYLTKGVGDARLYVEQCVSQNPTQSYRVYACGGDGTLCEVVNGALASGRTEAVSVGVIPSGTGNDFVRNFTNKKLFEDIRAQINGKTERIDLLRCNDWYAINMVNIGFDCEVVCKKAELQKHAWLPAKLSYVAGLVLTLIRKPGLRAKIRKDGGELEEHCGLLNTYANGGFCGGGFFSNPKANLTDGKIDALYVHNVSRTRFVRLVGSYKKGEHLCPKNASVLQSRKHDRVELFFDEETNVSIDGEISRVKELRLSVERSALSFILPQGVERIERASDKTEQRQEATV